jgi:hypothetical protein
MHCAGSIAASEGIEQSSSVFADEGTAAHELAAACLRNGRDARTYEAQWIDIHSERARFIAPAANNRDEFNPGAGLFEVTAEMVEAVQLYLDVVREARDSVIEPWIENKIDLTFIPGMEGGTVDALILTPNKLNKSFDLHVIDLKYGKGVAVGAQDNPQLLIYALGAIRLTRNPITSVRTTIVQPRCPHPDGPVRTAVYDMDEITEFTIAVAQAARATMQTDAPLAAGDHCKFCPAAFKCAELRGQVEQTAAEVFGDLVEPDPSEITPERLTELLTKANILKGWIKRIEEYANKEAHEGRSPPGFKLVAKRANRKWKDEGQAYVTLSALLAHTDIIEEKLISPAAADKLLGKKNKGVIEPFVSRESSGTILVPQSDPRPPAKLSASETFQIEYGEE